VSCSSVPNAAPAAALLLLLAAGCDRLPWESAPSDAVDASTARPPAAARVQDPGVLAVVNGVAVTQDHFRRRMQALPDDHPSGFVVTFGPARIIQRKPRTSDERKILLEELVKEELMVQDALSAGVERDAEVRRQLDDARRMILLNALTQRDVKGIEISDEEVQDHYNRFKEVYKTPAKLHVRQIAARTLQEAEQLRAQAVQGGDFSELAQRHSAGAGKDKGGDVGWYIKALDRQIQVVAGQQPAEGELFPQLEAVVFSMEVGQVSQPVKGPDGLYYVVKVEERRDEQARPLAEISEQLRTGLLVQKRQKRLQEHIDRLWTKGNVQMNEARLEQQP
jgi:peptidyl-prolyl cis-trans isomerase C